MNRLKIRVERDGEPVLECPIEPGLVSIGRGPSATIRLDDRSVSRLHAIILVDPSGANTLQDVGSRNGTLLNGRPIARNHLAHGDVFAIGSFRCRLINDDGALPVPEDDGEPTDLPTVTPSLSEGDSRLFIGSSDAALELLRQTRKVAASPVNVLITGESGSGKGVIARLLHGWSPRALGPFIVINCAAIPAELVESELFGHRKGAFTGASSDRRGKFQAAEGGTLFLDEIGDMPLAAQAKILRAIEDREIERVGDPEPIHVDVRVLAATHRDLDEAVREGRFRQDLLYRLDTVRLMVPALRDRPDDILLLANWLLDQKIAEMPLAKGSAFTSDAAEALLAHPWPGNVRELSNVVAQALILKSAPLIRREDLRLPFASPEPGPRGRRKTLVELQSHRIAEVLAEHDGNVTHAAITLGISRKSLYERMARFGLKRRAT